MSDLVSPAGVTVQLPGTSGSLRAVRVSTAGQSGKVPLVFGHGLGRSKEAQMRYVQGALKDRTTIIYDSRGHGESSGWETSGPEEFTWEAMKDDVFAVADAYGLDEFCAGGNSMTTATAIYTAVSSEQRARIRAFVLCRAPTAWDTREARRADLLERAEQKPTEVERAVFVGAAGCNLPPQGDIRAARIATPVVLMSTRNDPVHPVETAEALHALIPGSSLHIYDGAQAIDEEFPDLIRSFLNELDSQR